MLSRSLSALGQSAIPATRRLLSTEAAAASSASMVNLNFSLPHRSIYANTPVYSVILPGSEGEYGITANHVPYVAQLKPGVVQILHSETGGEAEKYFVCGGYALTHPNSTTVSHSCVIIYDFEINWMVS
jgi:F-type H+-transporting ATPase subunit delta